MVEMLSSEVIVSKPRKIEGMSFTVELTGDDFILLLGGLRETLEAVDDWEYHSRLGFTKGETRELLSEMVDILCELGLHDDPIKPQRDGS